MEGRKGRERGRQKEKEDGKVNKGGKLRMKGRKEDKDAGDEKEIEGDGTQLE